MGIGGRERAGAAREERENELCGDEREKRKKVDVGFSRTFFVFLLFLEANRSPTSSVILFVLRTLGNDKNAQKKVSFRSSVG